ncbi:MAG: hypothetical protein IT202_02460 [Fimbriimonadaceae bacterium]|nr:hypothetical protein [Fimbriimonadaceae bacterium]
MVYYLATEKGRGAIHRHYERYAHSFSRVVQELTYDEILRRGKAPAGTFIFADYGAMNPVQWKLAGQLWEVIRQGSPESLLINHPARVLTRKHLLKGLFEQGLNRFNAYALDEPLAGVRFPVFLRTGAGHSGALSGLLNSLEEVRTHADRLILAGMDPKNLLIVEFEDTSDGQGRFRKYGAFRIGGSILPRHLFVSRHWEVRLGVAEDSESVQDEERRYLDSEEHLGKIMSLFEFAGIEYGRLDYSLVGDSIQTWEINDNPNLLPERNSVSPEAWRNCIEFGERYERAMRGLDRPASGPATALAAEGFGEVAWAALHEYFSIPPRGEARG